MCLYPKLLRNPHFKDRWFWDKLNSDNEMFINRIADELIHNGEIKNVSQLYVPIGCGRCVECLKKKANEWRTRLLFEMSMNKLLERPLFVTLTFRNEALDKLENELEVSESNAVATVAVRRFLERVRKKKKKSYRHFLVTELGGSDGHSERIHLHGVIWTNDKIDDLKKFWSYGNIYVGEYCNERSINYIVKYIFKLDPKHKGYIPKILCSPGIGAAYCQTKDFELRKYNGDQTNDTLRLPSGQTVNMPIYYRNKLYNEWEKMDLWWQKIQKKTRYVNGIKIKIDTEEGIQYYKSVLTKAQEENKLLGYGDSSEEWAKCSYNTRLKTINIKKNLEKKLTPIKKDVKLSKNNKNNEGNISLFKEKVVSLHRDSRNQKPRRTNKKWSTQLN